MNTVITILLTLLIVFLLYGVFRWVGTPYYRIDKDKMVNVLERVLTGQSTENEWNMTFGMTIRHSPELEVFRQQCCEIEEQHFVGESAPGYLFSQEGLSLLLEVLENLRKEDVA